MAIPLVNGAYKSPSQAAYEESKKKKVQPVVQPSYTPPQILNPGIVDINAANRANAAAQAPVAPASNTPAPLNRTGNELFDAELNAQGQGAFDLFGVNAPRSKGELVQKTKLDQEMERARQEQQQKTQFDIMGLQNQQQQQQMRGVEAASVVGLAQGREGPTSASVPMAMEQARTFYAQNRAILEAKTAQTNRDMLNARADLQKAQEEGNTRLASQIQSRIVSLEQEQSRANLATQEALNQAAAIEVSQADNLSKVFTNFSKLVNTLLRLSQADNLSKVFTNFEKLPAGIFSTMTPEQISVGTGVDFQTASMLKALDTQRAALQPTDPDYLKKVAELNKTIEETKYVGMTESQKNYLTYKNLLVTDPEYAEKFAQSVNLSPTAKEQAETLKAQQEANLAEYDSSGVYNPIYSKYGVTYTPNGVRINVEANTVLDRWQCGAFVNDVLFGGPNAKGAGDSYASKKNMVNSTVPVAGGAVVFDTGDANGHIGIVERVYADGSFDMVDSNRKKNKNGIGVVDRTHLKPGDAWYNYISGYVDPAKFYSKGKSDEKETILDLVKSGNVTDTELIKLGRQAARQGWGQEFRSALKETTGVESASVLASVPKDLRSSVTSKANQFDAEQEVKNFQTLQVMKQKANSVSNDTLSPQDDQLLVYTFAKAMDPNSAVKEGEYDTIQQNSQTALKRWGVSAERFYSNVPFLDSTARKNIKDAINKSYVAQQESYNHLRNAYIKSINKLAGKELGADILQDYALPGASPSSSYRDQVNSTTQTDNPYYYGN